MEKIKYKHVYWSGKDKVYIIGVDQCEKTAIQDASIDYLLKDMSKAINKIKNNIFKKLGGNINIDDIGQEIYLQTLILLAAYKISKGKTWRNFWNSYIQGRTIDNLYTYKNGYINKLDIELNK